MLSRHHIRLIQVSNSLDLNIYAKTPWGPRVIIVSIQLYVFIVLIVGFKTQVFSSVIGLSHC